MILQSLNAYYERKSRSGELAPEGFEPKEIPFVLVIDGEGRLVQIDDTRSGDGKKKVARSFLIPQAVKRSVGIAANLLWDTAEYVLGFAREGGKPERVIQQHAAFKTRINELSATANDIGLNAVQRFLETFEIAQLATSRLCMHRVDDERDPVPVRDDLVGDPERGENQDRVFERFGVDAAHEHH